MNSRRLIVRMIRTQHIPFIQSRAATPVITLTACVMAVGIYLPFSPVGEHLGMVPLPMSYFPWLAGILLSYCVLTQLERPDRHRTESKRKPRACQGLKVDWLQPGSQKVVTAIHPQQQICGTSHTFRRF
jgi:magnesium-transporting ATPase (P-type)